MPFNPCLIGNWCVGKCYWNDNDYRGICHYDPIEDFEDALSTWEFDRAMSIYNEWREAILYYYFYEKENSSTETLNDCKGGD